jgi:intraflagellar transport protein 80
VVHIVDVSSGKPLEATITHSQEIVELYINQVGQGSQRKIAFIDKNHDLHLSPIHKPRVIKLAAMVNSALWSDKTDMLAAIMDGRFVVWMYPNAVFFDRDLANLTKSVRDTSSEFGKNPHLVHFLGKTCTVRRTDGTLVATPVSPYPLLLFEYREKNDWESCVRLCRFVQVS